MVPTLALIAALAAPGGLPPHERSGGMPDAQQLHRTVARMQDYYERAHDLEAHFDQTFVNPLFHKTLHSTGTLEFKKPGMIRFDYDQPEPKLFVVKGDRIVTYVPAAQQAMVGSFHADRLSASVTFLWGRGQLEKEFAISPATREGLAPGIALELTPRVPDPRFQRIDFVVDPKTAAVLESVVIDGAGDENRFDFSQVRTNLGLADSAFEFTPPRGTQITKLGQP